MDSEPEDGVNRVSGTSIAVIGAGNWGGSLVAALKAARLEPPEVVKRGDWRKARSGPKLDAQVIWICVPDAAIVEVAERIAEQRQRGVGQRAMRGQIVVHSSGALTAEVLEPVRRAGARTAAVHPVMSFPTRRVVSLRGVMFGVEAREAAVRRDLFALVRRMGGVPFAVKAETKGLYHAAGVMASPLVVSALVAAMKAAELAGLDAKSATAWVRALAEATVTNVFQRGPERSFSGPFARGDAETIHLHLQALHAHPYLADVYRSLARHAIAALPVKNRRALKKAVEPVRRSGSS